MIIYEFEIKKVDLNLSEVHEICDGSETTTNRFSMDGGHVTLISWEFNTRTTM